MKFSRALLFIGLLGLFQVVASNWVGLSAQSKWQETELRRWLSDHDISHQSQSTREELEQLVRDNWQHKVAAPWTRAKDQVWENLGDAKQWVFDTWDDTLIKRFLDTHGVTTPKSKDHNVLVQTAKDSYDSIAQKAGDTARYPGDWLYAQWSDSQLKTYLDKHGYKVPQHTARDRLIAAVRRTGFLASKQLDQKYSQASTAVKSATATVSDAALQKWSDADFRAFFEKHGVKVPTGYSRAEIMSLVQKYRHLFTEHAQASLSTVQDTVGDKAKSAAEASEAAKQEASKKFEDAIKMWSTLRLKEYLASRKVAVRANASKDELVKQVYEYRDKVATEYGPWIFDTWSEEHLKNYLISTQHKAVEEIGQTRDQLVSQVRAAYDKASRTSGADWSAATDYLASTAKSAVDVTLHGWSRSDIEDYLKSFGIVMAPSYAIEGLREEAQRHASYFRYGMQTPGWTRGDMWGQVQSAFSWMWNTAKKAAFEGRKQGKEDSKSMKQKFEDNVRHVADEL